ncbi:hypothetical protein BS47DRAFT_1154185 [Hydnum rufescens UP504]|uniref:Uncharacterized protein n=1 Tax=Hydnum rufescens UP504 TaxID=1448309 RepID=A0A9P6DZH6_9AGAM|nr:hypothetical protein BS47DRAFT_1154185 [Hydnum rufescens UP504]
MFVLLFPASCSCMAHPGRARHPFVGVSFPLHCPSHSRAFESKFSVSYCRSHYNETVRTLTDLAVNSSGTKTVYTTLKQICALQTGRDQLALTISQVVLRIREISGKSYLQISQT